MKHSRGRGSDGSSRPRHAAGTPTGGQFAPKSHSESEVSLAATTPPLSAPDDVNESIHAAAQATNPRDLQSSIDHIDERVRVVAARNKWASDGQLRALMAPSQPTHIRIAAASQRRVATALLASRDTDHFVHCYGGVSVIKPPAPEELLDAQTRKIRELAAGGLDLDRVRKEFASPTVR